MNGWRILVVTLGFLFGAQDLSAQGRHADMREGQVISVWIGTLRSEEEIDSYLSSNFSKDFGFVIDPIDGPEHNFSKTGPIEIRRLLREVSWGKYFSDSVAMELAKKGHTKTESVLVFYHFRYNPKLEQKKGSGKMKFVGTFPLQPREK